MSRLMTPAYPYPKSCLNTEHVSSTCNNVSKQVSAEVWHRRVGHLPYKKLRNLSLNISFKDVAHDMYCDICPKAGQQRLSFPVGTTSSSHIFALVHVDTWGPYHKKTHAGHRYFLTIVDDYTRATWLSLIHI